MAAQRKILGIFHRKPFRNRVFECKNDEKVLKIFSRCARLSNNMIMTSLYQYNSFSRAVGAAKILRFLARIRIPPLFPPILKQGGILMWIYPDRSVRRLSTRIENQKDSECKRVNLMQWILIIKLLVVGIIKVDISTPEHHLTAYLMI